MSLGTFWKKSNANKLILVVALVWIGLAVVFGIYDLKISEILFDSGNYVGNLVHSFGEIPGILFGLFALFTLWTGSKFKSKKQKRIAFFGGVLISTALIIYLFRIFFEYFSVSFNFVSLEGISLALGIIFISLLGFYLFKTRLSDFSEKNYLFSKLSILLFLISGLIVQILKFVWGRVRYEDVVEGLGSFTAWYLPQGITGGSSFPSGHVFLAWVLIPLFLIANKNKISKWLTLALTIIFGIFISYERVVIGAHYASDVLFSGGITILIFLILYKKYFPKKKNFPTGKKRKTKRINQAKHL